MDAIVEVLFERLRTLDLSDLKPLPQANKLSSKLKALEQAISKILPALPAVVRQTDTNREAEQLMQAVTKWAYQLEMLLDELQSEALLARDRMRDRYLMGCFNPSFFTCFRLQKRLASIMVEFRRMEPKAIRFSSASADLSDQDQDAIYGREDDLRNLVEHLLSDGEAGIAGLRIVGSPGIGKTTLARLAYNDARIESHFQVRAWILVSENFDAGRVTRDALDKLGIKMPPSDDMTLAYLLGKLQDFLSNKRFLLVLDHVGEIDLEAWRQFKVSLAAGAPGSRVLMTMNTDANASWLMEGSLSSYELKRLTDEDCWSLLESVAFPGMEPSEYSHLVSLGKELVKKCEGQPLATKVIGRILRDKMDEYGMKNVLEMDPWGSHDENSLYMSYDGLPARLKLCFAYCTIFPKDYKLVKKTLIQFWIAENLVEEHRGTTSLETIAEKYFLDLKKSFLLDSNEDDVISMPTPVSNLARLVSGGRYYHCSHDSAVPKGDHHTSVAESSPKIIRYISCLYDVSMKYEALSRYINLRTLIFVCSPASSRAIYSGQLLPNDLFTHFPELRALSFSGLPMQILPASIGNLKQLRFLDLSHTLIEKLPDTVTTLCNLLTLRLNNCVYIAELPSIENLSKLRHLDISGSRKIKAMPQGIGRLIDLHSLSDFIVRDVNESLIKELKDLVHLSGKLTISGLQNVSNPFDVREANLGSKTDLRELVLEWKAKFSELRNENVETDALGYLKPCSNLENLSIICYGGTEFPEWISLSHKLVHVTLSNCRKCKRLPLLGQLPLIKTLIIEGMDEVNRIGAEFCGDASQGAPFPSLETLEFKNMPSWEEWSFCSAEFEGLPRLKVLKIERCPKLKEFKVLMKALEQLTINECKELAAFSLEDFPRLRELDIQYCSNLKEMPPSFPSLTKLRICGCHELTSLSNIHATSAVCEEFPCLLELDIQKCTSLRELPQKFPLLEKLRIRSCKQLFKLSMFPKLHDLILEECEELTLGNEVEVSSLASMVICQLPKFVYPRAQLLQCLSRLINLEISKCENLEALIEEDEHGLQVLCSLERLVIDGCPKLKQLPDILSCFLSLRELIIMGCDALEFFPEMALPPVCKRLVVAKCMHLKSLPPRIFDSQEMSLEFLEIYGCPSLVSLSECNKFPESLRLLSVSDCANLKSLPMGLNRENTSLTSLRIGDCHSLENFPHEGLPCNIRSLFVINCGKLKPLSGWGLDELECLRSFSFGGCPEMVDFDGALLPHSVVSLLLKGLPKLNSLSGMLKNLNSLDILTIRDCPRLEVLAVEKLPLSLSCLYVSNCSILRQRCKSGEGQDWSKIKHIPLIEFDFQSIR